MYSNIIGVLGLFIESLLPLPQILLLNRLQLVKNFKVILLLSWLGGDCTKISYLLFGTDNILIIFIVAGLFQMSLDIYIAFQYLQFKYFTTTNKNLNDGASLHRRNQLIDDVVNDLVSVSSEIRIGCIRKGTEGYLQQSNFIMVKIKIIYSCINYRIHTCTYTCINS